MYTDSPNQNNIFNTSAITTNHSILTGLSKSFQKAYEEVENEKYEYCSKDNMCTYPRIHIDKLLCVENKDIQTRQNELRIYIDVDSGSSDKWSWGPSLTANLLECTNR
jgi:hypothetical protein